MKGTFKIEIDKKITEQSFMEHCLNLESSGYNSMLSFVFYAFGKSWHIDKFLYYKKLINDTQLNQNVKGGGE